MALAVNNVQENAFTDDTSFAYDAGIGAGRVLVISIAIDEEDEPIVGVTFDGVALSLGRRVITGVSTSVELWYLLDPAEGSNTLAINATAADQLISHTCYVSGADTTEIGATAGNIGDSTALSCDISPEVATSILIAGFVSDDGTTALTQVAGTTLHDEGANVTVRGGLGSQAAASTSTHTLEATAGNDDWGVGVIEIKAATGSPSASVSPSPSVSVSLSPSPTPSLSISLSPSVSESLSPSLSESLSISLSASSSVSPSSSISLSESLSESLSVSLSPSSSRSVSVSLSISKSPSPSISLSPSLSPSSSLSLSPSFSASFSPSPSPCEHELSVDYFALLPAEEQTLSTDYFDVLFPISYDDKYTDLTTGYQEKYSKRYICYSTKYPRHGTNYVRKYTSVKDQD